MNDIGNEIREAERLRNQIQQNFEERDQKAAEKEPTDRIDSTIRGNLQKFAVSLDHISREISDISENPTRYRISPNEVYSMNERLRKLEDDLSTYAERFKQGKNTLKAGVGINFRRDEGSENPETRGLSTKALAQTQMEQLRNQERLEEALVGTTQNLVVVARDIGDELDLQNKLLDDVDQNVENATQKIEGTTYRMKLLLYKSSDGCLMCCIVILIIVLVLLIIYV